MEIYKKNQCWFNGKKNATNQVIMSKIMSDNAQNKMMISKIMSENAQNKIKGGN